MEDDSSFLLSLAKALVGKSDLTIVERLLFDRFEKSVLEINENGEVALTNIQ
jgi:hypothetical protein